ncbi:hypothetical protein DTO207G8_8445 [Paecilomyces variotii]|nr:hypothetical protein DTO207G8_8445 [Paecilomyces variotii]KAJ9374703.1 hypothetical protein DTO282E5_786 [Paecilomyces variotii]KAJ9398004.1 hypothetical protein DTO282F9_5121 [Paecilomyces variotii]
MSFLRNLRGNGGNSNPSVGPSPPKKDSTAPQITPLERMLQDVEGPVKEDGSDKFFGMENYGNTCYCNSILQCLYYSVPFRESVINYPKRTPIDTLEAALAKTLRYQTPIHEAHLDAEGAVARQRATSMGPYSARSAGVTPTQPPPKPEDKDSPEYKKKMAMQTLPLLETKDNAASYGMPESLFTSLKDIFESVVASQSRVGVIRPQHFLDVLKREHEMFRSAMHQDAHEFLNLLLNEVVANVEAESSRLEEEKRLSNAANEDQAEHSRENGELTTSNVAGSSGSKTPNTTRWVHELFEGTLTSETQCLTCEKVSQRDEVFLDLSVDLDQHSSVTSCLRKFSAEEMLCERNKFHCDNCGGLQEAEKRMKIKRLPRILALHLKRFKYTEDLQRLQKLFHRVVYPYHLRLFNTTDDAEDPDRLYELYAVVVHIGGGPYHGHYVAIIKTQEHGWLLFDDEMVEPVDKNFVRNFFGDRPGLACAYVLFYQETTLEAVQREQEQEGMTPTQSSPELKDLSLRPNGMPPDQVHISQGPLSDDANRMPYLNHIPSAPPLSTPAEQPVYPTAPPIPPSSSSPVRPLNVKKSDLLKKEKKEEKERKAAEKAAEKEKDKAQKLRRKEDNKREESELKAALEASKATKADEDKRNAAETDKDKSKENGHPKNLSHGLGRFKRGSKTIGHKLVKEKDRRISSDLVRLEEGKAAAGPDSNPMEEHPPRQETLLKNLARSEDHELHKPESPKLKHEKISHGKWRGFGGLRKKSFSILS